MASLRRRKCRKCVWRTGHWRAPEKSEEPGHFGLAARFVTGYLYDDSSGTTRGGGSTHAWCSVYLPGAGWVEYDPTNGLVAGANLIRVGVTREAGQALPISGGFIGNADDSTGLHVDVSVRAVPIQ